MTSALATLNVLYERLASAAISVGLTASDAPELTGNIFRGGEGAEVARLPPSNLPGVVRALRVGRYAVLLGLLPDQASQPRQSSVAKPALAVARLAPLLSSIIPEDQSADDDGCGRRNRREW